MTAPRVRVLDLASKIPRPAEGVRLAAIDIGSNSIRQIVADVSTSGTIRIIDEMKAAPRLGAGLSGAGKLSAASMRHALEAVQRMATLARQLGAVRIHVVATSAVREAENRRDFLDLVREETGLRVRLLTGEDEARLSFRSALAHFDLAVRRAVVMDIGGGSLELAMSADGVVERLESFPFGALRLTEEFLGDRPRPKQLKKLRSRVREGIRRALPVRDWRGAQLIGSGGTFTNLGAIHLAARGLPFDGRVHGTLVPREEIEHLLDMLLASSRQERAAIPGLNPQRADIILAGLAVAAEVMARIEVRELTVSGYGIREGLLLESARVAPMPADPGEARERSVRSFAERCHFEQPHAEHVQRLALQLFDALGRRLALDQSDRAILADAALLHDVGYHIGHARHHKHSFHLISHAELLGVSPEEQMLIAHVARYHRGAEPKKKHREFGQLERENRRRIRLLAAILRLADGLDRGHVGAVRRVKVRFLERAVRVTLVPHSRTSSVRLEVWGGSRKSGLLEKVIGRAVELVAPDGTVLDAGNADRTAAGGDDR
jgi:exopolyphosphatase/guanosine-5'-triphosphate,3'-diphosphate pyrophosphatase